MKNRLRIILLALLTSCGGGGGDNNKSSNSSAPVAGESSVTNINTDPLLTYQWHIQNTGSSAFASILPIPGIDMNVMSAWIAGYTGKGIKVAVVDTGIEVAHEDLSANIDLVNSFNFITNTNDPTPSSTGHDHGTEVAGLIGAVAFNGKGGRGVAYNVSLRGYNFIANQSLVNLSNSLGGAPYSAGNDIFNESFSDSLGPLPPTDAASAAITAHTLTLRNGKGAILVQSAGNEFHRSESSKCTNANYYKVSCGDTATDTRRAGYGPIIVGAFNSDGIKSSYSTAGTAIWVSAPGGEFGINESYYPGLISDRYYPALITTSITGCNKSANGAPSLNALDSNGLSPYASNCQYTALMNGTSSAAPNASAVSALMLEANPNLGFRDVKYILAKTAKRIDPTNVGISSTSLVPGATVTLDQGWVKNAAGYWFSTWYGFGAIDASAAVALAKTYTSYLVPEQSTNSALRFNSSTSIPYGDTGVTLTFNMNPSFRTVEHVLLFTNLSSTGALTCNQFELTSPSGTKSILIHAANGYSSDGVNYQSSINNARLLSNAFYGEPAAGSWTLKLLNFCSNNATTFSSTDTQTLSIVGH